MAKITIKVNGVFVEKPFNVKINSVFKTLFPIVLDTPFITSPTQNQEYPNATTNTTFTASAFSVSVGSDTPASSEWQILDGATVVLSGTVSSGDLTQWTVDISSLPEDTNRTVRVRYISATGVASSWSNEITFKRAAQSVSHFISHITYSVTEIEWGVYDNVFYVNTNITNTITPTDSEIQIAYDSSFSSLLKDSMWWPSEYKTHSIGVYGYELAEYGGGTTYNGYYYIRSRYLYNGVWSDWSETRYVDLQNGSNYTYTE